MRNRCRHGLFVLATVALVALCPARAAAPRSAPKDGPPASHHRAAATSTPKPGKAAPGKAGKRAGKRGTDPGLAHPSKGPPPTWSIRPPSGTRAQASDEEYTDADPPPWNARWGCAFTSGGASSVLAAIGLSDESLKAVLVGDGIEGDPGTGCVPYALLTSEESGFLAVALVARDGEGAQRLHVYSRERVRGPITGRSDVWPPAARFRVISLDPDDAMWNTGDAERLVPADLTYTVVSLTRALVQPLEAAVVAACDVHIVTETDADGSEPHLVSVELVDRASGRPLGQAIWVDRPDLPGGFYAANGESYEPLFWVSPVNFTYVSRGIRATGPAAARAASVPGSSRKGKSKKRQLAQRIRHDALHIGIDYVAPVGMPVVAVAPGDALAEKLKSNLQEVRARGGELYVFADRDAHISAADRQRTIALVDHAGLLSPILHVIPLQLLAYHVALLQIGRAHV